MFDIGWSEVLIVGFVALIVVGPKELPALLRTIGRYVGMIKKQAAEFRSQFDDALREGDLADLRKEVEGIGEQAADTLRDTERSLHEEMDKARSSYEEHGTKADIHDPDAHDENGVPVATAEPEPAAATQPPADPRPAEPAASKAVASETSATDKIKTTPAAEKPVKSEA